jgi:hypothetical protein
MLSNLFKKKPIKLCKDCKYIGQGDYPECQHPKAQYGGYFDFINGGIIGGCRESCQSARKYQFTGFCGKKAKYFEDK